MNSPKSVRASACSRGFGRSYRRWTSRKTFFQLWETLSRRVRYISRQCALQLIFDVLPLETTMSCVKGDEPKKVEVYEFENISKPTIPFHLSQTHR